MGDDDARLGPPEGAAAPPRDDPAVGDDRPRAVPGGSLPVVEDLRLPDDVAGLDVERVGVVVVADVDDLPVVDGDVPHAARVAADELVDVVGQVAAVLPDEVAGGGFQRLDDVGERGHVHHAAVGERGDLLGALRQGARPRQLQLADVVAVHLVEGAVAPAVEGAPPHRPVGGVGVLEHLVGDRHELAGGLGLGGGRRTQGEGHDRGGEQGRDGVARLQHLGTPLRKCGRRPVAWASARRRQPGRSAPGAERCCPARCESVGAAGRSGVTQSPQGLSVGPCRPTGSTGRAPTGLPAGCCTTGSARGPVSDPLLLIAGHVGVDDRALARPSLAGVAVPHPEDALVAPALEVAEHVQVVDPSRYCTSNGGRGERVRPRGSVARLAAAERGGVVARRFGARPICRCTCPVQGMTLHALPQRRVRVCEPRGRRPITLQSRHLGGRPPAGMVHACYIIVRGNTRTGGPREIAKRDPRDRSGRRGAAADCRSPPAPCAPSRCRFRTVA